MNTPQLSPTSARSPSNPSRYSCTLLPCLALCVFQKTPIKVHTIVRTSTIISDIMANSCWCWLAQVEHRGLWFHLADSMAVRDAFQFHGINQAWHLQLDAALLPMAEGHSCLTAVSDSE
ncbi:hypothetical protein VPH35_101870 [Triticum aestivum]|uniref:Uncharacterized protein n=1 Tax=Aegilops tauschii subsp. strangulata TaxID=200361 RepID=A0A453ML26_AEGTS